MSLPNSASKLLSKSAFALQSAVGAATGAGMGLALLLAQLGAPPAALCTPAATVTSITISAGGSQVTSVTSGTVVTLTAKVTAGGKAVSPGQVNFCDAAAKSCTDIHLLATVQLTKTGTAVYKFRPGIGSHRLKAEFLGTKSDASSASSAAALDVTGKAVKLGTTTAIGQSGSWGQYQLSAAVTEVGSTAAPTGTVSFADTSAKNAVLAKSALGQSVAGLTWNTVNPAAPGITTGTAAVGDFNGDGIPDLALINTYYSNTVAILLGNGDGTFTAVSSSPSVGEFPAGIAVGDFNGDGKLDLAITENGSNSATILLGNGDGTFTPAAANPATGIQPMGIAVGDFNGDGIADLAVACSGSGTVTILLGKGDGTFTAAAVSPAVSGADQIVVADFNGDGKLDLAVGSQGNDPPAILLGHGDGSFTKAPIPSASGSSLLAAADVNGDGKIDLLVANYYPEAVSVLLGNGDGTFTEGPAFPQTIYQAVGLVVADFNMDGIPDMATLDSNDNIEIFLGQGDGAFADVSTLPATANSQPFLVAGDFNGDGRPDLAASGGSQSVTVFETEPVFTAAATAAITLATPGEHAVDASYAGSASYLSSTSGTIQLWGAPPATTTTLSLTAGGVSTNSIKPGTLVTLTAAVKAGGVALKTGQVNFCDAAAPHCTDVHIVGTASVTSNGTATYRFAPGVGQHSYQARFMEDGLGRQSASNVVSLTVGPAPPVQYSVTTTIGSSGSPGNYALTATVEGFGGSAAPTGNVSFLDTSFSNTVLATAPLGTATSGMGWLIGQTPAFGSQYPLGEVTADFNGDGIPDLAVLWTASQYGGSPVNLTVYFASGDGTFTAGPTTQAFASAPTGPVMIAGDFNGDGKADLAILTEDFGYTTNYVTCLIGKGGGSFASPITSTGNTIQNEGGDVVRGALVAGDFNGDGKMDLALVGNSVAGGLTVMLGAGNGSFTPAGGNILPSQAFSAIAKGDFNGDGIPDLAAGTYFGSGAVFVFLGRGDGTFTQGQQLATGGCAASMLVGDFNGDGHLDMAIGCNGGATTVLLGKGDGSFSEAPGSPPEGPGISLVLGDFNHDGKLDLAGIDQYNDQIDILEGNGDGTFQLVVTTPKVSQSFNGPFEIVAADFNKNGVPDLAMLTQNQDTVTILLTQPTETATATVTGIAPIGAGTHNVEASYAGDSHYAKSVSSTVPLTAGLEPPTITPASGSYSTEVKVTITETIPGATIYYQAWGTVNTSGYVQYTGPFFLSYGGNEQISTYATETGYNQSSYVTATYNLVLPAAPSPVFSPAAGSYKDQQAVTITDAAGGAAIYYTTNGATPTLSSTLYTVPIAVSTSELISAIAVAPGYSMSSATSAQYLIGSSQGRFVYTVAGTQAAGYSGDGGPATSATVEGPITLARSSSGDLYIADEVTVRKVAAGTGIITTVAGNGFYGYSGDGKLATKAELGYVYGLAIDKAGDLYIGDESHCVVRKVAAATGTITTAAGNGKCGYSGDNGPATSAQLEYTLGLALDKAGNLYIGTDGSIRKVAAGTGTITTFAGTGIEGYSGDNGPATKAQLGAPDQIVFDAAGNLYFVDEAEEVVRKIAAGTMIITTVAGKGPQYPPPGSNGDGGPATSATLSYPQGLAIDAAGNLYISDTYKAAVREVTAGNQIINTIAGNRNCSSFGGDGGPALAAAMCYPLGLAIDPSANLYVADLYYQRVREITAPATPPAAATAVPVFGLAGGTYAIAKSLTITAAAGAEIYLTLDGSTPTTAGEGYYTPITVAGPVTVKAIALAPGLLPSAEVTATYNVTAAAPATIATVAGSGTEGLPGAGGPALQAELGYLYSVAADSAGNLYIADPDEGVVWKLTAATQTVSVAAGTLGLFGRYTGEGGPAAKAILGNPEFVALNSAGDLFISDWRNQLVYKVAAQTGIITRYAGGGTSYQYPTFGDGGAATLAVLEDPGGIALDSAGNLYIADSGVSRVRKVDAMTGIISTVAGATGATVLGDGGLATAAMLNPGNLAFDASSNLYIVDRSSERIRKVDSKSRIISTVAGTGIFGFGGDGGPATSAPIGPFGIAIDASGAIYFSNVDNTIRKFVPGGAISTISGTGYWGFAGDGGPARMAEICGAAGLGFDKAGSLYIADGCNYRVRKVSFVKAAK